MVFDDLVLDAQHHNKLRMGQTVVSSDEDRISNLPGELLTHILSFLPTEVAVRTSLLSTKWKHLWTTVTILRFNDDSFRTQYGRTDTTYFANFVRRVLLFGSPLIHSFSLSYSHNFNKFHILSWISAVISRNVQKIHITTYSPNHIVLPCTLFNNDSVTELNLSMRCSFEVPTSICFSRLKVLNLHSFIFMNVDASRSTELHMTFPVLEELYLSGCKWKEVNVVNVDAPRLNTLSFNNYNIATEVDHVIKIHGSSLEKITFNSLVSEELILTSPSSITHASLHHYIIDTEERIKSCLMTCSLFRQFSNLKFLTLDWDNIEVLEDLQDSLPTLSKLIQLTVTTYKLGTVPVGKLITVLWIAPILESLNIKLGSRHFCSDGKVLEVVPLCFWTHLKVVKFQISSSRKGGLEFVRFLLKNAMVLEKMSIYGLESDIVEIKENLLEFPRGSDHASISFDK